MSDRYGPHVYTIPFSDGRKARVFKHSRLFTGPCDWNDEVSKATAECTYYRGIAETLPLGVHVLDAERCMISVTRYD